MTKNWTVKYRYKESAEGNWLYDVAKTQASSYTEAKNRIVSRLRVELKAWEIEL